MLNKSMSERLPRLILVYVAASLIHFVHNAEFLADYPNLPLSWTRSGVYGGWLLMTMVGMGGWILISRGYQAGLLLLGVYAVLGWDSLAHYFVAPFSEHTVGMNLTILLEVTAASLVFVEVLRQLIRQVKLR